MEWRAFGSALARLQPFGVTTWAQALLRWVVSDERVHCTIPATSRVSRVTENAVAGNPLWFDDDARRYVTRLLAESKATLKYR
jgi:diketogulonate reductase-like aldo/keto reductase